MAENVIRFPVSKGAPFRLAVEHYLTSCFPGLSEAEREELTKLLEALVDRYKTPEIELKLPAEAFPTMELAATVKKIADEQITLNAQGVFCGMLTELIFLHCHVFALERELARLGGGPGEKR